MSVSWFISKVFNITKTDTGEAKLSIAVGKFSSNILKTEIFLQNLTFGLRFYVCFYIHTYQGVVILFPDAVGIILVVWETFIACTTPKSATIHTLILSI